MAPVFPLHRNQNKSSKLKGRKTKASGGGRVGRALEFGDKKLESYNLPVVFYALIYLLLLQSQRKIDRRDKRGEREEKKGRGNLDKREREREKKKEET